MVLKSLIIRETDGKMIPDMKFGILKMGKSVSFVKTL